MTKPLTILTLAVAFLLVLGQSVHAQTFAVLYSFQGGTDGANPDGVLLRGGAGDLYGTTSTGGELGSNGRCSRDGGCGTVFKLNPAGKETVLHRFNLESGGGRGAYPVGGVLRDAAGNLYGTASGGGYFTCRSSAGCGLIFELDRAGKETVLRYFRHTGRGYAPAGLVRDSAGNFYGVAGGGYCGRSCGLVYELKTNGVQAILHFFEGGSDGLYPTPGLTLDKAGDVYGTTDIGGGTACGGVGCGTVYKINKNHKETVLYSFAGGSDGSYPAGLVADQAGNLYGVTSAGGGTGCGGSGCGTVFKISANQKERVLYRFSGGADGANPDTVLVRDHAGNLYGTTAAGGSGSGTVFMLDKAGVETVLHSFTGGTDGGNPEAGLVRDATGALYGTASIGGGTGCGGSGCGVVFKITP